MNSLFCIVPGLFYAYTSKQVYSFFYTKCSTPYSLFKCTQYMMPTLSSMAFSNFAKEAVLYGNYFKQGFVLHLHASIKHKFYAVFQQCLFFLFDFQISRLNDQIELSSPPGTISPKNFHVPKAQPSTDVKVSSHITDAVFRLRFEPCVSHSVVLKCIPNYSGGHLLLASHQELY